MSANAVEYDLSAIHEKFLRESTQFKDTLLLKRLEDHLKECVDLEKLRGRLFKYFNDAPNSHEAWFYLEDDYTTFTHLASFENHFTDDSLVCKEVPQLIVL